MHNANKQLPGYMPGKTIQSHCTQLQELSKQVVKTKIMCLCVLTGVRKGPGSQEGSPRASTGLV